MEEDIHFPGVVFNEIIVHDRQASPRHREDAHRHCCWRAEDAGYRWHLSRHPHLMQDAASHSALALRDSQVRPHLRNHQRDWVSRWHQRSSKVTGGKEKEGRRRDTTGLEIKREQEKVQGERRRCAGKRAMPRSFCCLRCRWSLIWKNTCGETFLVVRWLRLCTPNAGAPGSIPDQGTGSHTPQWKLLNAAVIIDEPVCCNQDLAQPIKLFFKKEKEKHLWS